MRLSGGTLGVTWFTTSVDEADMAINTRFGWSTANCTQVPGAFDLQTVYLHENGHVAGLGHSSNQSAVMFPSYQTARCTLARTTGTVWPRSTELAGGRDHRSRPPHSGFVKRAVQVPILGG